ncbi:MAG TPA: hypothetical protein DEB06_07605 [Phycisphaerales bacterium]|nr:hypothetical protein [Phycisphaerales bacterium]
MLVIPAWFTAPAAAIMTLAVLLHALATARSNHPPSRKRIRIANAFVITAALPLLVLGFSVIDHAARPGQWTLVWMSALALLAISISLAMADVLNTLRLVARHQHRLRARLSTARDEALRAARSAKPARGEELLTE